MDNAQEKHMYRFGLLGKDIDYSFSRNYFANKFKANQLPCTYENFDIKSISEFPHLIQNNPELSGLNVTIPYKEAVLPYLDAIDNKAKKIGAVNTIKFTSNGKLKGYNTDYYGFIKAISPSLKSHHKNALILGTGGASKAIAYALKQLKISYDYVSRFQNEGVKFTYDALTIQDINHYQIIINCTPIGTHPNTNECPNIPYDGITQQHLLFDLIYNPEQSKFLMCGELQGAVISNGYKMLEFQAEKSWDIWNKP